MKISSVLILSILINAGCKGTHTEADDSLLPSVEDSVNEIIVSGEVRLSGVCGNVPTEEANIQTDCGSPFSSNLTIFSLPDKVVVKSLSVGTDGKFSVGLLPGKYVAATPKKAVIAASRTEFIVSSTMKLPVRILVSAGIR